jgi:hypothetical protein
VLQRLVLQWKILVGLFSLFLPGMVLAQSWYDTSWQCRQMITIYSSNPDFNLSGDLSNYPVLVTLTDGSNPLFGTSQSDGDDILFTASDGTTKLPHEIENYNDTPGSEQLVAWVRVPTFSSSSDTVVYMYYGNSTASNQQNTTGVWDADFVGVWHLEEGLAGTGTANVYSDSTINTSHGDDYVSATGKSGKILNGQQFDGADDYIDCGNNASLNVNYLTVQLWLNVSTWTNNGGVIAKGDDAYRQYWMWTYNSGVSFEVDEGSYQNNVWSPTAGQWEHLTLTYDGSDVVAYRNGGLENSYPQATGTIDGTTEPLLFGYIPSFDYLDGLLDEIRVSRTVRSTDWIKADYVDQNDPGAYLDFAPQEDLPVFTGATLAADNSTLDITFSEAVYDTAGGSGALETSDFTLTFSQNGGDATDTTISSVTRINDTPLTGGETDIRLHLSITGAPNGVETIEVQPAINSIFDVDGYAVPDSQTTGQIALNDQSSIVAPGEVVIRNNILNTGLDEYTTLSIRLDVQSTVSVKIYDLAGDLVRVLYNKTDGPGLHEVTWDGKTRSGRAVVPGVYYIVVKIKNTRYVQKVLVLN